MRINNMQKWRFLVLLMMLLVLPWGMPTAKAETFDRSQYIYDFAHLLTDEEAAELQQIASEHGEVRETAFIVITLDEPNGKDIVEGEIKFLYVSPERLQSRRFLWYCEVLLVKLIAVDEAHCI